MGSRSDTDSFYVMWLEEMKVIAMPVKGIGYWTDRQLFCAGLDLLLAWTELNRYSG
jgi:hypothetical protein